MIFGKLISGHFDISMSQNGQLKKKSFILGMCQNSVLATFCNEGEPRYPQTHPSAYEYETGHAKRRQETSQDTARH